MYISPKRRGDIPGSFLPKRVSEGHLLLMVSVTLPCFTILLWIRGAYSGCRKQSNIYADLDQADIQVRQGFPS